MQLLVLPPSSSSSPPSSRADRPEDMAATAHETRSSARPRPPPRTTAASLLLCLAVARGVAAAMDCSHVQADNHEFDLSALKGPHSVVTSVLHAEGFTNVTYTLDLCGPLKVPEGGKKGCPDGTWACGMWHHIDPDSKADVPVEHRVIAGTAEGRALDEAFTRLSTSTSDKDKGKEGVRIVLQGGQFQDRKQKAVVELLCKDTVEGTEGEIDPDKDLSKPSPAEKLTTTTKTSVVVPTAAALHVARADGDDKNKDKQVPVQIKKPDATLIWESYGPSEEDPGSADALKLTWYTKHACEKRSGGGGGIGKDDSKHWGFFTWIVILVFLGAAAYLIFGSWLNYTRYGARGWDLLPHGDTIRDVPYLLQDWVRRLFQTVQGGGSRGGYSAV
ncbi:hypothetical protein RB595_004441 [Gaeumannomyces hyphopodioides]